MHAGRRIWRGGKQGGVLVGGDVSQSSHGLLVCAPPWVVGGISNRAPLDVDTEAANEPIGGDVITFGLNSSIQLGVNRKWEPVDGGLKV